MFYPPKKVKKRILSTVIKVDNIDKYHAILTQNNSLMIEEIDDLARRNIKYKTIASPVKSSI